MKGAPDNKTRSLIYLPSKKKTRRWNRGPIDEKENAEIKLRRPTITKVA